MSNSLITIAILTALSGGAFAAALVSDPCASPCGSTGTAVSTSEVWSGGSDTGSCIPEMGPRRHIGSCTETECSINEVAYKDDDNCKVIDVLPCEPEKPVIAPRESSTSVAIMDEGELQDRRSGCIPVLRPPPPPFTLACYRDGRDEPGSGWGADRDYPWNDHDRCYDVFGNERDPDDIGPCFDRWGCPTGDMKTPYGII